MNGRGQPPETRRDGNAVSRATRGYESDITTERTLRPPPSASREVQAPPTHEDASLVAAPFGPLRAPMGVWNCRSETGLRRVRKCGAEAYGPPPTPRPFCKLGGGGAPRQKRGRSRGHHTGTPLSKPRRCLLPPAPQHRVRDPRVVGALQSLALGAQGGERGEGTWTEALPK